MKPTLTDAYQQGRDDADAAHSLAMDLAEEETQRVTDILMSVLAELKELPNPYDHAHQRWFHGDASHEEYQHLMSHPGEALQDWATRLAAKTEQQLRADVGDGGAVGEPWGTPGSPTEEAGA